MVDKEQYRKRLELESKLVEKIYKILKLDGSLTTAEALGILEGVKSLINLEMDSKLKEFLNKGIRNDERRGIEIS